MVRAKSNASNSAANLGFEAKAWLIANKLHNKEQSYALAVLRNTLLPNLLSWKLNIAEDVSK